MKAFKLLFVLGSMLFLPFACEEPEDLIIQENLNELNLKVKTSNPAEVPFKARLFTEQAEDALTTICSFTSPNDFWALEHQIGGGNATHLGNFEVDFKFCFHIVLDEVGQPDLAGGFGEYNGAEGDTPPIIIAANGDHLYAEVREESNLVPIQDENYNFEFDDVWYITGGTGRFENATGEFVGRGMIRSDGTGTDHVWEGTIILN